MIEEKNFTPDLIYPPYLRLQRLDALLQQPLDLGRGLVLLQQLLGAVVVDAVLGVDALHGLGVPQEALAHHLLVGLRLGLDLLLAGLFVTCPVLS